MGKEAGPRASTSPRSGWGMGGGENGGNRRTGGRGYCDWYTEQYFFLKKKRNSGKNNG